MQIEYFLVPVIVILCFVIVLILIKLKIEKNNYEEKVEDLRRQQIMIDNEKAELLRQKEYDEKIKRDADDLHKKIELELEVEARASTPEE